MTEAHDTDETASELPGASKTQSPLLHAPPPLPDPLIEALKATKTWQPACPVPLGRLALVTVKYLDFQGDVHEDGEIVVFDAIAHRVSAIFNELFKARFPIAKMRSLHHYNGNDETSMEDNNSSCFNFRSIAGSKTVSMHGLGLAIDINPLQNPFVTLDENRGIATIRPSAAWQFLNRHNQKSGMAEPVVATFQKNGFVIWGGRWTAPIDYHHFQPPQLVAELLLSMPREDGARFFDLCAKHHHQLSTLQNRSVLSELEALMRDDTERFFKTIETFLS